MRRFYDQLLIVQLSQHIHATDQEKRPFRKTVEDDFFTIFHSTSFRFFMENFQVINNLQLMHLEIREGDNVAYLEYRFYKDNIAFMHTEVPKAMEGKGIASSLAAGAFQYAASINKKVIVYCPFVAVYLKRHPELSAHLDPPKFGR